MTAINREHLELAALAAGMTPVRMDDDQAGLLVAERSETWRPHLDIADAARLAANLQMRILWMSDWVSAVIGGVDAIRSHDGTNVSKERAYCEAVTLCAAAIGRQMMDGEQLAQARAMVTAATLPHPCD